MNCIRVPFHYKLIEKKAYRCNLNGVRYLDQVISWAKKHNVYIILDLHAACGSQNPDWHSDSGGHADLWRNKRCQERTLSLWEFLADRYKDNATVAGYDLLNESEVADPIRLNRFYKKMIKSVRKADKNHIIFIEGNKWASNIHCLDKFEDDKIVLSIHFYWPIDFTANLVPHLSYPMKYQGVQWNKSGIRKVLKRYAQFAKRRSVPVYVGEFGVNYRSGFYGEDKWLADILGCFKEFGFHWTYWTYKSIKTSVFPDGIYSYFKNSPWVNRQGPQIGWRNYKYHWKNEKMKMIRSWKTDQFSLNKEIIDTLRHGTR